MPELPEVETMCRGIGAIVGHRIDSVERPPCRLRPIQLQPRIDVFARRVQGKHIVSVGRRGKRVLIGIEDSQVIVIEPRMTGLVLLVDPPTQEHLRLRMPLQGPTEGQLLVWDRRGLATVRLWPLSDFIKHVDARLGIDALAISPSELRERLKASRRQIKVALLDQSAVAGIGNLYAAEILFLAGVDPRTRCDRLTHSQWARIHQSIQRVLEEAIRYEGSTLGDGTYRNALNNPGGYQNCHRVYDRAGLDCPRCKLGQIRRIVQAQRSTFFCPVCQQKRGVHSVVVSK